MMHLPERVLGLMAFQEVGCRFMEWSLLGLYLILFLLIVFLLVCDWRHFLSQHSEDCSFQVWMRGAVRQYVGPCILLGVSLGFVLSGVLSGGEPCDWLCDRSGG